MPSISYPFIHPNSKEKPAFQILYVLLVLFKIYRCCLLWVKQISYGIFTINHFGLSIAFTNDDNNLPALEQYSAFISTTGHNTVFGNIFFFLRVFFFVCLFLFFLFCVRLDDIVFCERQNTFGRLTFFSFVFLLKLSLRWIYEQKKIEMLYFDKLVRMWDRFSYFTYRV